jgi:hypothetical protein
VAGRWFSPGTLVSSTNKTDRHDIADILLEVALNTINLTLKDGRKINFHFSETRLNIEKFCSVIIDMSRYQKLPSFNCKKT